MLILVSNSMQQSLSWEANSFSANQKFPSLYATGIIITEFRVSGHLSLLSDAPSLHFVSE